MGVGVRLGRVSGSAVDYVIRLFAESHVEFLSPFYRFEPVLNRSPQPNGAIGLCVLLEKLETFIEI